MDRIKLLILDDEIDIVESIRDTRDDRFNIVGFTSMDECTFHFKKHPVDVLITDYQLKTKLNGLDYISMISKTLKLDIPFILFTGAPVDELEHLSNIQCSVIQKPILTHHLLNRVVQVYIAHLEQAFNSMSNLKMVD